MRIFALLLLLCIPSLAGCDSDTSQSPIDQGLQDQSSDSPEIVDRELADCANIEDIAKVRAIPHPAGGVELELFVDATTYGSDKALDFSHCLSAYIDDQEIADAQFKTADALAPGFTLLLMTPPKSQQELDSYADALEAFMASRPAKERFALYRWGEGLTQITNFTSTHSRIIDQLQLSMVPNQDSPLPAIDAIDSSVDILRDLAEDTSLSMRTLVVIAPDKDLRALIEEDNKEVIGFGLGKADEQIGASQLLTTTPDQVQEQLLAVSSLMDRAATSLFVTLGYCGEPIEHKIDILAEAASEDFTIDPPLPEHFGQSAWTCDAAELASGERHEYPQVIEFVFSDAQREIYQDYYDTWNKDDFELSIRFESGLTTTQATAHIRGNTSLGCTRKSFTVDLDGGDPRMLMPFSATDEFYLISMCLDDRYVNQYTANLLLADWGLFPLRFAFVRLDIDGENQGVYLMLEKTTESLRLSNARVRSIFRRRGYDGHPEVEWTDIEEALALENYQTPETLLATLEDEALEEALRKVMDLDQYFEWIALMSLLQNGDFVDETWVLATETIDPDNAPYDYYTYITWDPDDLFSECHKDGQYAIVDPHELLYCVENSFDHTIFSRPYFYDLWVHTLERVLDEITEESFNAYTDQTAAHLLPFFAEQDTRKAMIELLLENPSITDQAIMDEEINDALQELRDQFKARRALLYQRIEAYRQGK